MSGRPLPRSFWTRIDTSNREPEACWPWMGSRSSGRYGHIMMDGKFHYAHRLMYAHVYGPIPPGLVVMHKCDNPVCCRPSHLSVGTNFDNILDSQKKGRRGKGWVLGADRVREIRRRVASGERIKDVARDYPMVSPGAIYAASSGATWRHVQ